MKKVWQIPQMEVLNVSETMLGAGRTHKDWTYVGAIVDEDLYDDGYFSGGFTTPPPS